MNNPNVRRSSLEEAISTLRNLATDYEGIFASGYNTGLNRGQIYHGNFTDISDELSNLGYPPDDLMEAAGVDPNATDSDEHNKLDTVHTAGILLGIMTTRYTAVTVEQVGAQNV